MTEEPDGADPPPSSIDLHVTVGKPFGEHKPGDHEYIILVQGTNLIYSPSGSTTRN